MSTVKESDPLAPFLHNIRIVLINTTHPGNIGSAARAMMNMGLSQLYLVDPVEFPSGQAIGMAGNAVSILDNAKVVSTLEEAIGDCGLVLGTSARERSIPWPLHTAQEAGVRAVAEASRHPVAILFGREDRGLTNDELHRCHAHLHIPSNPMYSALNIAQAVQVLCYELRQAAVGASEKPALAEWTDWDIAPVDHQTLEYFFQHLEQTIVDIGFHDRDKPRQTMTRLRRMFSRIRPDEMEIRILHGILTGTQHCVQREQQLKLQLQSADQKPTAE